MPSHKELKKNNTAQPSLGRRGETSTTKITTTQVKAMMDEKVFIDEVKSGDLRQSKDETGDLRPSKDETDRVFKIAARSVDAHYPFLTETDKNARQPLPLSIDLLLTSESSI